MTEIGRDVGNLIAGGDFAGPVTQVAIDHHQHQHEHFYKIIREAIATWALDPETITYARRVHVASDESRQAMAALDASRVVALVGDAGSGRWTTGVALLAERGTTPHSLEPNLSDRQRRVETEPGFGYLLDLDHDQLDSASVLPIVDQVAQVRAAGAPLVIRARPSTWKLVAAALDVRVIHLRAPNAAEIFRSHLNALFPFGEAVPWLRQAEIVSRLTGAKPADAARLARIVREVNDAEVPEHERHDAVLSAYDNWSAELADWFQTYKDGHTRARIISAAALPGAEAEKVFAAAGDLVKRVDLPPVPGTPLTGADLKTLITEIDAELRGADVHFTRPGYAGAVLDHVWQGRPHLRPVLRKWAFELPEHDPIAVLTITELAIRQADASLLTAAVSRWVTRPQLRVLAVDALTSAAVSEPIGREIRKAIYDWARAATLRPDFHEVIAEVCGGQLAEAFPQIALTRLRHLASRESAAVQDAVVAAIERLVHHGRMRITVVLHELSDWVGGYGHRQASGRRAFVKLAELRETDGGVPVLLTPSANTERIEVLALLWRDALRHPAEDARALTAAMMWLDATVRYPNVREVVFEMFARTCLSSIDEVKLTDLALTWDQATDGQVRELALELIQRGHARNPLTAAAPAVEGAV